MISSSEALSSPAAVRRVARARWYSARARSPEIASMRRTPAAVDCSETILKTPISPVRCDVGAAAKLLASRSRAARSRPAW